MHKTHFPAILRLLGAVLAWGCILSVGFSAPPLQAQQDINIVGGTNPYLTIGRGLSWAGSGPGNLNNNFIFSPIDPNQGFCVFLSNNNPSNSHTVSVSTAQTGDPTLKNFIGFAQKWFGVPTQTSFPVTVPAFGIVGINYKTSASAGITVSFSGATAQAGSPDTVDVFVVQTNQNSCGQLATNSVQGTIQQGQTEVLSNQFPVVIGGLSAPGSASGVHAIAVDTGGGELFAGSTCCQAGTQGILQPSNFMDLEGAFGGGVEKEQWVPGINVAPFGAKGVIGGFTHTNFLEMATDMFQLTQSLTPAWVGLGKLTNPAAGATLLHLFSGTTASVNPALKTITLSCSAACEITLGRTTALGTTCTALTPQNLNFGNNGLQQAISTGETLQNACATAPTASTLMYDLQLPAGGVTNLDLSGFTNFHSSGGGSGIDVIVVGTITGVATASLTWAEE